MPFLRPSFIDNMGWHMAEVYGAVTDRILINLARYFPYYKPGQSVPQSSFEYQANMLAQMGQVTQDTIKIIRASLGGADDALTNILEQAIMEAVKKAQPDLFKAVQKGLLNPTQRPVVDPSQMRAYSLYYQQAAQKLNMVNTVMLESTQQAYQATVADIAARVQVTQNALDIGAAETVTGVSSWNQALRNSIDRMKQNGITGFIDHAGHKWSAEAYTAMDIRTTVANTARAAVWETNQDFGNDLYIVSYHDGARPLCYPWQNKVISSTDNARVVTDLDGNEIQVIAQKDTSYGEPAGLFGINCKHYPSPFIPGVSVLYDQSNIMSEKENEKVYEQTQQQRALERQIREQKRDLLMAKAQGADKEELKALRAKIRETDDEIDKFCEETGLPRRQSRESAFTQRSFPPEDTYDVATFERTQKEAIDKYFNDDGSQQGYTFGQMNGKNVTPSETAQPTKTGKPTVKYGKLFDENAEEVTRKTMADLQAEFPLDNVHIGYVGDVRIYEGMDESIDVMDLSAENPKLPDSGAQYRTEKNSKNGIPAIVVHNEGYDTKTTLSDEFNIRARLREKYPVVTSETAFDTVADSLQGTLAHEYAHAVADNYGFFLQHRTQDGDEYLQWLIDYWEGHREELIVISKYAASNPAEMFAEAFVQVRDTAHKNTQAYQIANEIISEFRRRFIK